MTRTPTPLREASQPAFEIVTSKLTIPLQRPGFVHRTALVNRLRSAAGTRIVSVAAPAGYGKTTLLSQWAERDRRPFAWVSLDARDNDPVVLLTYLATAINSVVPLDAGVFRSLKAGGTSLWSTAIPRLSSALASLEEPLVLVVDDVHELREQDCLDSLETLSRHLPHRFQLVLSGRSETKMPVAKVRAAGDLFELGTAELKLTDAEAQQLLEGAGVDIADAEVQELNRRAEGWPAGLHLAVLSLGPGLETLGRFEGDDRFVADYFRSEELSHLRPKQLRFLTRTPILERMSGPLCDAVLERSDSARMLEALERENVFLVPLDHHREWYRYHHLFRDMLRSELMRREPNSVQALNRRASKWCEGHGSPDSAIDYATAAGDLDNVARLVASFGIVFYRTGRVTTAERWFRRFDEPELLVRYPGIAVRGTWLHALRGRPDDAERWAAAVEASRFDGPMSDGTESLEPWVAVMRAMLCRQGIDRMKADAALGVAGLSAESRFKEMAMLLQGIAVLLTGDLDEADRLLSVAAEAAASAGAVYAAVMARAERALIALARDEVDAAEEELLGARAHVDEDLVADYLPTAIFLAADARVAVRRGAGARARYQLAVAQRLRPQLTYAIPWFAVQTQLELASAHLALGDTAGTGTLLREAQDVLHRRPHLGTLVDQADALRGQLAATRGRERGWASTLTAAELRLLPLLTTHFSFREIAERLFVSRNTVKTQAISVYRKLDASSRSEAVARAIELGLVDDPKAATLAAPEARQFT